ncbi:MAG: trypsin-like peptidase domain-containing protein [Bdellovibrionaceae bacterium]|nr:trypsin-like peptidase domain-containing protein [Pseudobdellovibrionaceae bacterium]
MKHLKLVTFFIFSFLYSSNLFASGEDIHNILQKYGQGHHVWGDRLVDLNSQGRNNNSDDKDCSPRNDNFGGRFYKTGIWGEDDRRPLEIDEASLPANLRLTSSEKKKLKAVSMIWCIDKKFQESNGTGFIVNIDKLGASPNRDYEIIATASHVLYNSETGEKRSCTFIPDPKNHPEEEYVLDPVKCGAVDVRNHNNGTNGLDWCFAKIGAKISQTFGSLEIDFTDKFNYTETDKKSKTYLSVGWHPAKKKILVSLNCSPDDKRKYSNLKNEGREWGLDFSKVMIGDCDDEPGSSGGPIVEKSNTHLKVLAMSVGDLNGEIDRGLYNPNNGAGNKYTKFTSEMKKELIKIVDPRNVSI